MHTGKPLVGVLLDFRDPIPPEHQPDGMGQLVIFTSPGDAVRALGAVTEYAGWLARDPGAVPLLDIDEQSRRRLVNRVLAAEPQGRSLDPVRSRRAAGRVRDRAGHQDRGPDARGGRRGRRALGWDVVLKASAPGLRARPDQAGVYRNIDDVAR